MPVGTLCDSLLVLVARLRLRSTQLHNMSSERIYHMYVPYVKYMLTISERLFVEYDACSYANELAGPLRMIDMLRDFDDSSPPYTCRPRTSMIVLSDFWASNTCFLDSFKYLRTSSFPPPGLYSPNCEMNAMELLIVMAEFQSSVASKNDSSKSGSTSIFLTLLKTFSCTDV